MDVRAVVLALAEPLAAQRGLTVVDVEYHGGRREALVRIVLHRAGGVDLDDVEGFHRAFEPLLDAADPIPGAYTLEVSSPGAERPLRTERDFTIFSGRAVRLAAREVVDGRREWSGQLLGVDDGAVRIACGPDDGDIVAVPLAQIAWAKLRLE